MKSMRCRGAGVGMSVVNTLWLEYEGYKERRNETEMQQEDHKGTYAS